jgi:hypothetical protein
MVSFFYLKDRLVVRFKGRAADEITETMTGNDSINSDDTVLW